VKKNGERLSTSRLSAGCILSPMVSTVTFRESRRSTRVPLKVLIAVEGGADCRTREGETIVVQIVAALGRQDS
jgi:hypothetical protein